MKMSDNPAKHEVLIKQYLRSILDISAFGISDATATNVLWFYSFLWNQSQSFSSSIQKLAIEKSLHTR